LGTYFLYHCFLEATTPFLSKLHHPLLRPTMTNAHYVIPTQQTRKHTPLAISLLARTTFPSLLYFNCFGDIPYGTPSNNLQSFRLVIKSSSTLYNAVQTYRLFNRHLHHKHHRNKVFLLLMNTNAHLCSQSLLSFFLRTSHLLYDILGSILHYYRCFT